MTVTFLEHKFQSIKGGDWSEIVKDIKNAPLSELKDCWNTIHNYNNKCWLWFAGAIRYEIELRELALKEDLKS